jgi:hypothetical protein
MWWWLACADPAPPPTLPVAGHADGWPALVAAVERGDLAAAKVLARDLGLGAHDDGSPATTKVGGGLGYLQVVDEAEDARDALSEVRAGCDACHAARGLAPVP